MRPISYILLAIFATILFQQNCAPVRFGEQEVASLSHDLSILGVTGGSDIVKDNKLIGDSQPVLHWTSKTYSFFKVEIRHNDRVVCPEQQTQEFSVQMNCDGDLFEGEIYEASVFPFNSDNEPGLVAILNFSVIRGGPSITMTYTGTYQLLNIHPVITDNSDFVASASCELMEIPNSLVDCLGLSTVSFANLLPGMPYTVKIVAKDNFGNLSELRRVVNTGFLNHNPALAIRAPACIACHAQVQSDFVTDLGYGNPWFAGKGGKATMAGTAIGFDNSWYGDWGLSSLQTSVVKGKYFVPHIEMEIASANIIKQNSVADHKAFLTSGNPTMKDYFDFIQRNNSVKAPVEEKNILIGTLTESEIISLAGVPDFTLGKLKYFPEANLDLSPSSLVSKANGLKVIGGNFPCNGDLIINGSVLFKDTVVKTDKGCRIYVTGPIFINGSITMVDKNKVQNFDSSNLQLVSSSAIMMGVGKQHCETANQADRNWYFTNCGTGTSCNPLNKRLSEYTMSTRQDPDGTLLHTKILQAADNIGSELKDASCRTGGRELAFSRILLNAPIIHSRFIGEMKGVVIGEVALFSVSRFNFTFDDIFFRVPLLPRLNSLPGGNFNSKILTVE